MKKFFNRLLCATICTTLAFGLISCARNGGETEETTEKKLIVVGTPSLEEQTTPIDPPPNGYEYENIDLSGIKYSIRLTIDVGDANGYYIVLDPIELYCDSDSEFQLYRMELAAKYSYIRVYAQRYSSIELMIPAGEYAIYWAEGEDWYGEENLFGTNTVYYKGRFTKTFTTSNYSLELKKHGNFTVDAISKDGFPK